jgi:dihydroneopterin aldolase
MLNEYTLRLEAIRFRANVGASRPERSLPQELVVDVELTLPVSALPARDHKKEVVDYDAVARLVVEEGQATQYHLLETYAQRLIDRLFAATPATRVRIAATKLRVPSMHSVDRAIVELTATRDA